MQGKRKRVYRTCIEDTRLKILYRISICHENFNMYRGHTRDIGENSGRSALFSVPLYWLHTEFSCFDHLITLKCKVFLISFFFLHTARALHRVLEWRNHQVTWPHITVPITEVINVIIKRINEASVSFKIFYICTTSITTIFAP